MSHGMNRRDFLGGLVAGGISARLAARAAPATRPARRSITDRVPLGDTGIRVSRLGMGTGTFGWNRQSNQTRLGMASFVRLLRHAIDSGIAYIDCADMYGSHYYLREAMRQVPRDKVVIVTKTADRTAEGIRKDVDRFRQELGTDYIDVVLLHCLTDADWTKKMAGPMDVLSEARSRGWIKAHGCSCHSLAALRLASETPWVDVGLVRINPWGPRFKMDDRPDVVVPILRKFKERGAGVLGMKILGEGQRTDEASREESLRFVLSLDCVDAFNIGFESPQQPDDIIRRADAILP